MKKQQRPTNAYPAEKALMKAIKAAASRYISQVRIKTCVANFPSESLKLSEKNEIKRNHPGDPITQLNHKKKQTCSKTKAQKVD